MTMQKNLYRFDLGKINSIERTPQGFLKIPGFATRTGVFTYKDAQGNVRAELRHPDDVFSQESLETLKNVPVTLEHPPEMVSPENFKQYSKGYTTDRVEVNRDLVETDVIVADGAAIKSVEQGERRELSCGYLADLVEETGDFNGTPYNYRQKNIRYNHLAVVKAGRGGPEVRLRMDSKDAVMTSGETKNLVFMGKEIAVPSDVADGLQSLIDKYDEERLKQVMEESMKKDRKDVDINQKGVSPKVSEVQMAPDGRDASKKVSENDTGGAMKAKGLDDEDKKQDEDLENKDADKEEKKEDEDEDKKDEDAGVAKSPMQALQDAMAEMKAGHSAQMDAMQAKLDEYASATMNQKQAPMGSKMDSKDTQAVIRARVKLERTAEKLLPLESVAKFDSMSDEEIYAAVIKHRRPKADLTGKSKIYLQTRFDSLVETLEESEVIRRDMGKGFVTRTDSETEVNPNAARLKMIESTRKDWQQPLSAHKK